MTGRRLTGAMGALLPLLLAAMPALAADAEPPKVDTGDTAWMLASTALVLMMTIPGLALFYAGMVRKKNILATLMQSFAITCIVTLVWTVAGYSLAFTNGNAYVGDLSRFLLHGIADHITKGVDTGFILGAGTDGALPITIPETVYMMFQMTFAIITPALIVGAFADRMKFSALCIFMTLWSLLIYSPIAHWVWAPTGWAFVERPARLRRRHRRAHQCRHCRIGLRARAGQAGRLRHRQHGAVQPRLFGDRCIAAVGRLVRLQRRLRGRLERPRRHGDGGDADRHRRCGAGLDVRRVDGQGQTFSAGLHLRRGGGSGGDHPGVGLSCCPAPRSSSASPPA